MGDDRDPSTTQHEARPDAVSTAIHHHRGTTSNVNIPGNLAPSSKYDYETIQYLSTIPPEIWAPIDISYNLLYWCADSCWSIWRDTYNLFLANPQNAIAPIKMMLDMSDETLYFGGEEDWLSNVLNLVKDFDIKWQMELEHDLRTFAPRIHDEQEEDWGLRSVVHEILNDIDNERMRVRFEAEIERQIQVGGRRSVEVVNLQHQPPPPQQRDGARSLQVVQDRGVDGQRSRAGSSSRSLTSNSRGSS